jgi:Transcriptional regulator
MRLEHLEYLVEISKTNSMSLAGKHLYVSHQGISSAIAALEKELAVKLINRTASGVCLTAYGEKYVNLAVPFLEELKALKEEISASEKKQDNYLRDTLSIYTAPLFTGNILPETISKFKIKYPDIKIITQTMDSHDVLAAVANEQADIGLVTLINKNMRDTVEKFNIGNKVKLEKLFLTRLYILADKSLPIARKKSISIKELLQYPLAISYELKNILSYLETYSELYDKPNIALESADFQTTFLTTAQGATINFLSEYSYNNAVDKMPGNLTAIPISDNIKYFVGWARTKSKRTAPHQLFIDILKTVI